MKKSLWMRIGMAALAVVLVTVLVCPPAIAGDEERAEKLYKEAHNKLSHEQYKEAASGFRNLYQSYRDTSFAADALYWRAFALNRIGGKSELQDAKNALKTLLEKHKSAKTYDDASSLYYRVLGQLAKQGDEDATAELNERSRDISRSEKMESDSDTKMMAMEALLNMDAERSVPILKKVLEDRRPESTELRRKATFMLSQKRSDESVDLLMDAARNDPDEEVRSQAIFWLSQTNSPRALDFLEEILFESRSKDVRDRAIHAISQYNSPRSAAILERIARSKDMDKETREQAIFWLGQRREETVVEFLIDLFDDVEEQELRDKIIFSISQHRSPKAAEWLVGIAKDHNEKVEMRKQALFWAGQQRHFSAESLTELYHEDPSVEFREHVIFVMSQQRGEKALDIMIDLAKREKNAELKKKLIFWIGQSNDPRAADFLMDIINE